eukprot:13219953-Alexandrium_andersonii.AAC.1
MQRCSKRVRQPEQLLGVRTPWALSRIPATPCPASNSAPILDKAKAQTSPAAPRFHLERVRWPRLGTQEAHGAEERPKRAEGCQ